MFRPVKFTYLGLSALIFFVLFFSSVQVVRAQVGRLICQEPHDCTNVTNRNFDFTATSSGIRFADESFFRDELIYQSGRIGIGTHEPVARLEIKPLEGVEGLRIISATNYSPLNIRNAAETADIFRVDQSGILQVGNIPWARLSDVPSLGVGGTGTTSYVARWTGTSALGTGVLYDNGANVGIGTISPTYGRLSIQAVTDAEALGLAGWPLLKWNGGSVLHFGGYNASQWSQLAFHTSGTRRMTILTGGNVGIGTDTPGQKLEVADNVNSPRLSLNTTLTTNTWTGFSFYSNATFKGGLFKHNSTDNITLWTAADSSSPRMTILNNGNVGVGTTAPGFKFTVAQDNTSAANWNNAQLVIAGATDSNKRLALGFDTTSNVGTVQAGVSGSSYNSLLLNPAGGNVGIGTTNPISALHVQNANPYLIIANSDTILSANENAGSLVFYSNDSSANSSGGIGAIRTFATSEYNTASTPSYMSFYTHANSSGPNGSILNGAGLLERMRIDSSGNVGIGTTAPVQNLHSIGYVRADTGFCISGTCITAWPSGVVASVTAGNTSLTISPTTGAVVASLNLANANTWTGAQTFNANSNFPGSGIWNTSGHVGIGITNPSARLHVSRGDGHDLASFTQSTPGTYNTDIWIRGGNSNTDWLLSKRTVTGTNDLWFYNFTSGVSPYAVMTLKATGNVGIGLTNPGAKLEVAGSIAVSGGGSFIGDGAFLTNVNAATVTNGVYTTGNQTIGGTKTFSSTISGNITGSAGSAGTATTATNLSGGSVNATTGIFSGNVGIGMTNPGGRTIIRGAGTTTGIGLQTQNSSGTALVTMLDNGNVGIGTTNPGNNLSLTKSGNLALFDVTSYHTSPNNRSILFFRTATGSEASPGNVATNNTIGEFVGAGWAGGAFRNVAAMNFAVDSGTISSSSLPSYIYFETTPNGSITRTERMRINSTGNVGIGLTNPTTRLHINGDLTVGSTGGGKINAGTVDPPYTINGKKYATYMASMTGVKEETTGVVTLRSTPGGLYFSVLDLEAEEGSDLWLFSRTANLAQHGLGAVSVLLAPNFSGRAWYEKNEERGLITIFASLDKNQKSLITAPEVSYRLTAPRFDSAEHSNRRPDDDSIEGFNLDRILSPVVAPVLR